MAFEPNVQVLLDAITKFSDADKLAFSQLIYKDFVQSSPITNMLDIRSGVQANDPIPFVDRGEDWEYMKDATGLTSQCDDLPCTVDVTFSNKLYNPVPYVCSIEFCSKDLELKMLDYFNSVSLLDEFNEGTFYIDFVKSLLGQRIQNSHWTKAFFAATTATSTALTAHDGLFVQYDAATTGTDNRVVIAKNDGLTYTTYADQKLTPQEGFDIINAVNDAVDENRALQSRSDVPIYVTRSIAQAYTRWLRENKQVNCCERDPQSGIYSINNLSIYDRRVIVVDEWDRIMNSIADFNNGTLITNPHRAVATYRDNHLLATSDANKLSEIQLKYDDYTGKAKFYSRYRVDSKLLLDDHVVLAM